MRLKRELLHCCRFCGVTFYFDNDNHYSVCKVHNTRFILTEKHSGVLLPVKEIVENQKRVVQFNGKRLLRRCLFPILLTNVSKVTNLRRAVLSSRINCPVRRTPSKANTKDSRRLPRLCSTFATLFPNPCHTTR